MAKKKKDLPDLPEKFILDDSLPEYYDPEKEKKFDEERRKKEEQDAKRNRK